MVAAVTSAAVGPVTTQAPPARTPRWLFCWPRPTIASGGLSTSGSVVINATADPSLLPGEVGSKPRIGNLSTVECHNGSDATNAEEWDTVACTSVRPVLLVLLLVVIVVVLMLL